MVAETYFTGKSCNNALIMGFNISLKLLWLNNIHVMTSHLKGFENILQKVDQNEILKNTIDVNNVKAED